MSSTDREPWRTEPHHLRDSVSNTIADSTASMEEVPVDLVVDFDCAEILRLVLEMRKQLSEYLKEDTANPCKSLSFSTQVIEQQDQSKTETARNLVWAVILGMTKDLEDTVLLLPDGEPGKVGHLSALGVLHNRYSVCLGNLEHFYKAIRFHEHALLLTGAGISRAGHMNNLGASWANIARQLGEANYLYTAIEYQERALLSSPNDHHTRPNCLSHLGSAYVHLYRELRDTAHLREAIDYYKKVVLYTPENISGKRDGLNNLASCYMMLSEDLDDPSYIHKAISYLESSVSLSLQDDWSMYIGMKSLGRAYTSLSKRQGDIAHIYKAIKHYECAVSIAPNGHLDRLTVLESLGSSHLSLFYSTGEVKSLSTAIECYEYTVFMMPDNHQKKPEFLDTLGLSQRLMFENQGKVEHLHRAIDLHSKALQLAPSDHPNRADFLSGLGASYVASFNQFWELEHLHKAIDCFENSNLLTTEESAQKHRHLNNLGIAYMCLFDRLKEREQADKAIKYFECATLLCPHNDPGRPNYLNNLGKSYITLFILLGEVAFLERAIKYLEDAVALIPESNKDHPSCLNNLGEVHRFLFEHSEDVKHLQKAIDYYEHASSLIQEDHPDKPDYLNSLCRSYIGLFKHLGETTSLVKAIEYSQQAILLTHSTHPEKPQYLHNLGYARAVLSARLQQKEYLIASEAAFREAALWKTGLPSVRLLAAHHWGRVSRMLHLDPLEAYSQSMVLLPQTVWLGVSVQRRYEHLISDIRNLVSEGSSVAIESGRLDLAVEWLEQGRCLVWRQMLQLRTPVDDLRLSHPELAAQFIDLRAQLEPAAFLVHSFEDLAPSSGLFSKTTQMLSRLANTRDKLIGRIRELPGYGDFLCPLKLANILNHVKWAATVVLNVDKHRCDALILQPGSQVISHVHLTNFSYKKAFDARAQLACDLHSHGTKRSIVYFEAGYEHSFKGMLSMLWYDVAKPVVDCLGINQTLTSNRLPHIIWCITGPLSSLPIHAAGDYDAGHESILRNLAISSYAPNLTSMGRRPQSPKNFSGILAVGQKSSARGMMALPGAKVELDMIEERFKGLRCTRMDDEAADTERVLRAMESHSWVHFACHGSQGSSDSLASALYLNDQNLDLATISKQSMKNAQLAYTSACETATGDSRLPDEAVHLAAGLLMAGYENVVATMWSISDQDGPVVADKFYEFLLNEGTVDSRKVAVALHKAVMHLQSVIGVHNYERWLPFIHLGG